MGGNTQEQRGRESLPALVVGLDVWLQQWTFGFRPGRTRAVVRVTFNLTVGWW
jgi:hypothetical protein